MGVGSRRVRSLFAAAKKKAPCIVFIDEIDAIGGSRKQWENHTRKTLNQLLTEMDGFEANEGVIVMAATNLQVCEASMLCAALCCAFCCAAAVHCLYLSYAVLDTTMLYWIMLCYGFLSGTAWSGMAHDHTRIMPWLFRGTRPNLAHMQSAQVTQPWYTLKQ